MEDERGGAFSAEAAAAAAAIIDSENVEAYSYDDDDNDEDFIDSHYSYSSSGTASLSRELFDAVATHNHKALLRLYALHARSSLWRYAATKSRWNSWIPASSSAAAQRRNPQGARPRPRNLSPRGRQQSSSSSPSHASGQAVDDNILDDDDDEVEDLVWMARLRQEVGHDASAPRGRRRMVGLSSRTTGRNDEFDRDGDDEDDENYDNDQSDAYLSASASASASASTAMPHLTDATTVVSSSTSTLSTASSSSLSTSGLYSASSSSLSSSSTNPISSFSSFLSFRPTTTSASSSSRMTSPRARHHEGGGGGGDADNDDPSYYLLLKELALLVSDRARSNSSSPNTNKKCNPKIEVDVETERLLRDAAAQLTESRPPPDLVVQQPHHTSRRRRRQLADGSGSDNDDDNNSNDHNNRPSDRDDAAAALVTPDRNGDRGAGGEGVATRLSHDRPPVFDGAVALATPGPPGGAAGAAAAAAAAAPAGGTGTILHLACAVDSPLALAFLLAMGGNPRATHTAFRRMMVHEAACNGSYQCLTLLLELGQEFAAEGQDEAAAAAAASTPAAAAGPVPTLMEQLDLPFLPRRMDRAEALAPLQLYLRPFAGHANSYFGSPSMSPPPPPPAPSASFSSSAGFAPPPFLQRTAFSFAAGPLSATTTAATARQYDGGDGTDFVSVLRLFKECCARVQSGTMSELDAARQVVRTALLDAGARAALATSCGFLPSQQEHGAESADAYEVASGAPMATVSAHRHLANSFLWRGRPGSARRNASAGPANNNSGGAAADGHGNTPLHWAAFKNEVDCVRLLLQYRANPNARASPSGWTPLHDAAYSNSVETISLLLDAGAQVDARANSGATPLCFAAQEDASGAAELLLERGADLSARCSPGGSASVAPRRPGEEGPHNAGPNGRFSGYTPLHYCAHYNAHRAARVLLRHPSARSAMEVADLSDRLPIHVAVARGSADVLRELLHAGARVETRPSFPSTSSSPSSSSFSSSSTSTHRRRRLRSENGPLANDAATANPGSAPSTPNRQRPRPLPPTPERRTVTPRSFRPGSRASSTSTTTNSTSSTPVSSPVLRSMIPAQPVTSSKPWNCLTQRSIDECRALISEAEQSWAPDRHELFTPEDRRAVMELLRVGKRLEIQGTGLHVQALWPTVLSFCGRGWFQADDASSPTLGGDNIDDSEEGSNNHDGEGASDGELLYVIDASSSVNTSDGSLTLPSF